MYIPKCSPINMLSIGMLSLPTHAFVYELQVEMYPIVTSFVPGANISTDKVLKGDTSLVVKSTLLLYHSRAMCVFF